MAAKRKNARRRPGGQPGNLNAVKHGFYSSRFSAAEVTRLGKLENPTDIESELQLLRVVLGRVARRLDVNGLDADGRKPLDDSAIKCLDRVVSVSTAIATLVRTKHLVKGEASQVETAIMDAIEAARQDLGLK